MKSWDTKTKRLGIAAVAAAGLLVVAFAFAATGGLTHAASRVPTIVSDRPLEAPDTAGLVLAQTAASVQSSATAAPAPNAGGVTAPNPAPSSRPSASKPAAARTAPTIASSSEGRDGGSSGEHEVVSPKIRDDEPGDEKGEPDGDRPDESDDEPHN